jgi:hypothetical protein
MARAKDRPASPAKTAKPESTRSRKSAKVAPDAPSMDALSPATRDGGGARPGAGSTGARPSPEQLYRMIQETAYFKAKARNFAPGHEVQDWIEAEAEVRRRIESRA